MSENKTYHFENKEYENCIPYRAIIELLDKYELKGIPERISFDNDCLVLWYLPNNINYSLNDYYLPIILTELKKERCVLVVCFSSLEDKYDEPIKTKLFHHLSALKTALLVSPNKP